MTIKKIGLSVAVASALASSVFALTVTPNKTDTISQELLSTQKVNINTVEPIIFTCQMNGTPVAVASKAGLQLTIPGFTGADHNISVYPVNKDGNITGSAAATFSQVNPTNHMIVFTGQTSFSRGQMYAIAHGGLAIGKLANSLPIDINSTVAQNSTNVDATIQIVSNNGVNVLDTGSGAIATVKKQFNYKVVTPASDQIDAASGFLSLWNNGKVTSDSIAVEFDNNINIVNRAKNVSFSGVINYDQNLTGLFSVVPSGYTPFTKKVNDKNVTFTNANINGISSFAPTVTFTRVTNSKDKISPTTFTTSASVTFNNHTLSLGKNLPAGQWTIYGYNAKIPNVAYMGNGAVSTLIKLTNRSNLTQPVYFTLYDQQGNKATFSTADSSALKAIAPNATGKYTAKELLAAAKIKNPNFNANGGSFSVEITVSTSPSNVYGIASLNTVHGYKVLPIYSNYTKMGY